MNKKIKNAVILIVTAFVLFSCKNENNCDHVFAEQIVAPTCNEKGYTYHYCTKCHRYFKDNFVDALGHDYIYCPFEPATIEKQGHEEHYCCSRCDEVFDLAQRLADLSDFVVDVDFDTYKNSYSPVYVMHGKTTIFYNESTYQGYISSADNLISNISNASVSLLDINNTLDNILKYINVLYDDCVVSNLLADATAKVEAYELATEISEARTILISKYYFIWAALARSTNYRESYFGNFDDENKYIQYAEYYENLASPTLSSYTNQINQIVSDYKAGKVNSKNSVSNLINISNDYAKYLGFANYLEYAYENTYGREYTLEDTDALTTFIILYVVPLYTFLYSEYEELLKSIYLDPNILNGLYEYYDVQEAFFGKFYDELSEYSDYIGGEYKKNFEYYFTKGSYYFSNLENKNVTGYVTSFSNGEPLMFLGKDYQSVTTFIHEFGHYNASFTDPNLISYDVAESQSQGNEMLFYSYLYDNCLSNFAGKFLVLNQLTSMLSNVLLGYVINEVEKIAYETNEDDLDVLFEKFTSIGETVGLDLSNAKSYLATVLMNYQGYYISYATSALVSLELFALGRQSMTEAKKAYISIYTCENSSGKEGFTDCVKNAGLYDVFSLPAFVLIGSIADCFK